MPSTAVAAIILDWIFWKATITAGSSSSEANIFIMMTLSSFVDIVVVVT